MYIQSGFAGARGLGSPAAAIELGAAALSIGQALTTGGDFQTTTAPISYIHPGTPPSQRFRRCAREFMISAFRPAPFPIPPTDPRAPAEKFWFVLQYEYNGNDLREVRIDPLPDKSSTLYKSKFSITFAPGAASADSNPIAAVRFSISGSWEHWDLPFNTKVGIRSGSIDVRADGSSSINNLRSERDWVNFRTIGAACPVAPPVLPSVEVPRVPIPQPYGLTVYFHPPGSDRIREADEGNIVRWFEALPSATRGKISSGALPVTLEGYASTTQSAPANRELSRRRALRVQRILQDIAGSATKFVVHAYGEYRAGTRDRVETQSERRVQVFVMDTIYR
jgi:OmpA family protein